ncbi:BTB/POZ domain-containing protein 6-B-like [Sitodiplosis mosellana]|uniref:BTB/POZ domain-containing protein 6-B-like n=1 Tax=Sitodiplosis mosellana TaxID=263140 RepID=UPI0024445FFF|nr:BTB/POZ domain-containing protein 6-B-like [Sitodiplosis mosellana]
MANVLKSVAASELIAKMYLNEEIADVHFVFKFVDDVQRVPANKVILAALSPVFHTMFYGSLKEGNEVKIEDSDADAFKEFLQFFYMGEVTLNMENIETVVRLADKYDILEYIKSCVIFLKTQLTIDNLCWVYQLAVNVKKDELIEICEEQIARLPKKIFATDAFQRCDKNILKRILELDLTCKETNVFEACLAWAIQACKQNGLDATKALNLRIPLGDCLQSIRFSSMTIEEFSAIQMSNDGLFTPDEFKDIVFTLTAKVYEPKIFKQNPRVYKWNKNGITLCRRQAADAQISYLKELEIVWFKSNQTLLLGDIFSAETNNMSYIDKQNNAINVTLSEISSDSSKKLLYEGQIKTWDATNRLRVMLTQPIMIKAHTMYEIRFAVMSRGVGNLYYHGSWRPIVDLADDLTIQFYRIPTHTGSDTSSTGWIEAMSFNRI